MATVNFRLKGKSIYSTLSISRNEIFERKTGFTINPKDWSTAKKLPIDRDENSKILKNRLNDLQKFIENSLNQDFTNGITIDSEWLEQQIKSFHGQNDIEESYLFVNIIQDYIDKAPFKPYKNRVGLSEGRIKNLRRFKKTWIAFQNERLKGRQVAAERVDKKTVKDFSEWLRLKNYSINYIGNNLSIFKAVLNSVIEDGATDIELEINPDFIKAPNESKEPEDVIYLSFDELEKIQNLKIINNYLNNARKWLVLGCYVGQRAGDLLNLDTSKIKVISGKPAFIIRQGKTKKDTVIPILPEAQKIIDSGFPHKISQTKLREYFKEICRLAEISEPKNGRIKTSSTGPTKKGVFPKWQLIGTHVCRRSFASNYYGYIPTPVLMQITNHSTEKQFLAYIGKPPYEYAMQMLDYVEKLPQQKTLRLIKNNKTGTNGDT